MAKSKKVVSKIRWLIPLIIVLLFGSAAGLYFTGTLSFTEKFSVVLEPMNGNDNESLKVLSGEKVTFPVPEREGYAFLGWYQIANPLDILITDETIIDENMILYAKWEISSFDLLLYDFGIVHFQSVSTGFMHSLAVTADGRLFAWGSNSSGQLGNGSNLDKLIPFEITSQFNLTTQETIVQAVAGEAHSLALTSNGRIFGWGGNNTGQVGDSTLANRNTPIDISSAFSLTANDKITSIQAGRDYSVAMTSEGRIFAWGNNSYGQLGDGTYVLKSVPTEITSGFGLVSGEKVTKLITGPYSQFAYTSFERIFAWGMNAMGNLGDGTTSNRYSPTDVSTLWNLSAGEKAVAIETGIGSTYVVTSLGKLLVWGYNTSGQLGNGTTNSQLAPIDIMSAITWLEGETLQKIVSGYESVFIITTSGRVFAFGSNNAKQLGDGTSVNRLVPTNITAQFNLDEDETIINIGSGLMHTLVLTSNGRIFAFGFNLFGQLGINSNADSAVPVAHQAIVDTLNFAVKETQVVLFNAELSISEPTKFGYIFGGWYLDEDLTIPFDRSTMPGNDLPLYPDWNPVF